MRQRGRQGAANFSRTIFPAPAIAAPYINRTESVFKVQPEINPANVSALLGPFFLARARARAFISSRFFSRPFFAKVSDRSGINKTRIYFTGETAHTLIHPCILDTVEA